MTRNEIEAALAYADGYHAYTNPQIKVLADAARAHLATLPRIVKIVRYAVVGNDGEFGGSYADRVFAEGVLDDHDRDNFQIVELAGEVEVKP